MQWRLPSGKSCGIEPSNADPGIPRRPRDRRAFDLAFRWARLRFGLVAAAVGNLVGRMALSAVGAHDATPTGAAPRAGAGTDFERMGPIRLPCRAVGSGL